MLTEANRIWSRPDRWDILAELRGPLEMATFKLRKMGNPRRQDAKALKATYELTVKLHGPIVAELQERAKSRQDALKSQGKSWPFSREDLNADIS